jgi:hypothetical protein
MRTAAERDEGSHDVEEEDAMLSRKEYFSFLFILINHRH